MLTTPFLTDLDSRAAVKGSRDPLGIQPIWTRLGRHVVGNLTTVSNSIRDFTTLLLGYYFAEEVSAAEGPETALATFLKWEQLAAYARAARNKDYVFRGTERVRRTLSNGSRVTLSESQTFQILSNQKIYGLYGLYTVPAFASGLLQGDPTRLTPPARELVERTYLPILAEAGGAGTRRLVELLRKPNPRLDIEGTDAPLVAAVAKVLRRKLLAPERGPYRDHLLLGGPQDATQGLQSQLADLLEPTLASREFVWSPAVVRALAKQARRNGEGGQMLAQRLERIEACERVMAPISALFSHVLGLDGEPVEKLTRRLRDEWDPAVATVDAAALLEPLETELAPGVPDVGRRWADVARALAVGDYASVIELLLAQNRWVMATRGGAPWVELDAGRLKVRFREESGSLPTREELPTLWRFPYFLGSLRSIAMGLRE
ncbi:MAG: hypothetical protein HYY06_10335 [Deltaproteobacteria bacterium]|nr:hypothetical protein [Deltaproteobacteria bacterium]